MEIREIAGESSANQTYLHLALNDAVSAYQQTMRPSRTTRL